MQCDTPWAKHTNKSTFRKNTYALKCEHGLYHMDLCEEDAHNGRLLP